MVWFVYIEFNIPGFTCLQRHQYNILVIKNGKTLTIVVILGQPVIISFTIARKIAGIRTHSDDLVHLCMHPHRAKKKPYEKAHGGAGEEDEMWARFGGVLRVGAGVAYIGGEEVSEGELRS